MPAGISMSAVVRSSLTSGRGKKGETSECKDDLELREKKGGGLLKGEGDRQRRFGAEHHLPGSRRVEPGQRLEEGKQDAGEKKCA